MMKRPLGCIGLVYLCVTAVVFYCGSGAAVFGVLGAATAAAAVLIKLIRRDSRLYRYGLAAGLSAVAAVLPIFLYSNYIAAPVINDYSDKEISIEGYICDELRFNRQYVTCVIQTETVNGEEKRIKINLTVYDAGELRPFDNIRATVTPHAAQYNYQLSRGVFLCAFQDDTTVIEAAGGQHRSLYAGAVDVRKWMKHNLDTALDNNGAPLAKAVLLGDKNALDADTRNAFTKTGSSYLIVVSGMHLAILTAALRRLMRRTRLNDWIALAVIVPFVTAYAAVTGFSPSVTRAAIMLTMTYFGNCVFREADGINSLGLAALLMTVPNPYIVGDAGMLLSFSSTFGILLWADKLQRALVRALRLEEDWRAGYKPGFFRRLRRVLKQFCRRIVGWVCVSAAATLWVIPLTVLLFETISPLTVVISVVAYPLIYIVLILSLPLALLQGCVYLRFLTVPLSGIVNLLSALLTGIIKSFSASPFAQLSADRGFYYIWLAVTAALVAIGYIIRGKRLYVFSAIVTSVLTLTIGGALFYLFAESQTELVIFRSGDGYTAMVRNEQNLSLLSCGGRMTDERKILGEIAERGYIDSIIIPSKKNKHFRYFADIYHQFDVSNILVYDNKRTDESLSDDSTASFSGDTVFTLALTDSAQVTVYAVENKVYQLIEANTVSVLLVPDRARLSEIPRDMLHPDYAVLEGDAEEIDLLDCEQLLVLDETVENAADGVKIIESGQSFRTVLK